jgi:hypothetical protein
MEILTRKRKEKQNMLDFDMPDLLVSMHNSTIMKQWMHMVFFICVWLVSAFQMS